LPVAVLAEEIGIGLKGQAAATGEFLGALVAQKHVV